MEKKTELQQQIERETGFIIEKVETSGQLDCLLEGGLADLYQEVFADPPYNEQFTQEEAVDIFREFLDKKGCIFVAMDKERPVAFVVSVPLRAEFEIAKLARQYVNLDETSYFAEDGVAAEYRRQGLSGKMKKLLLETNAAAFKKMLLRTSQENFRQISAVNKAGGRVLTGVFQDVARKRLNGATTMDPNAFYVFDLLKTPVAEAIDPAVIICRDGKDIAILPRGIAMEDRIPLMDKLRTTYPKISKVLFGVADKVPVEKTVFKGRLYLAK